MRNLQSRDALQMAKLAAAPSSWRILNLYQATHDLRERFGDGAGTFFQNRRLAESIIIKHTLRDHERDMFDTPPVVATKVLVPLQGEVMDKGAISFFVGERAYQSIMRQSFGIRTGGIGADLDARILGRLNDTPSLDLFLLRELLGSQEFQIPKTYFHVSLLDDGAIRAYITKELTPLIRIAAGTVDAAKVNRFVDSIFGPEIGAAAADFFRSMGLADSLWASVVFAWKAALFYETRFLDTQRRFVAMLNDLAALKTYGHSELYPRSYVEEHVTMLKGFIGRAYQRTLQSVQSFNSGRRSLIIASGDIMDLRRYLESLPESIQGFGGCIAIIEHVLSYWNFRMRGLTMARMPAEVLCHVVADICSLERQFRYTPGYDRAAEAG